MTLDFIKWTTNQPVLTEAKEEGKLVQEKLKYAKGDLDPCVSEDTINYHYGKLARAYVDRYNAGEGDPDFNAAGAQLHNILFAQYQIPKSSNQPVGISSEFISEHFGDFDKFKEEFLKVAMGIQGAI
jgi:Fe-Mn family superoxide dismutase